MAATASPDPEQDRFDQLFEQIAVVDLAELAGIDRPEQSRPEPESGAIDTDQVAQGDILIDPLSPRVAMPYWAQPERDGTLIDLIKEGNGHRMRCAIPADGRSSVRWVERVIGTDLGLLEITGNAIVYVEQVKGDDAHERLRIGARDGLYLVGRQREKPLASRLRLRLPRLRGLFNIINRRRATSWQL